MRIEYTGNCTRKRKESLCLFISFGEEEYNSIEYYFSFSKSEGRKEKGKEGGWSIIFTFHQSILRTYLPIIPIHRLDTHARLVLTYL